MTYSTILFDVADGVAVITLNRPEVRNAFGAGMGDEIADAYRRCDRDDDIRAVVITGTPPAFCAGADLSAGADAFRTRGDSFSAAAVPVRAWDVRKPVIAAVNGHAIGIGLTLTLQCDIRIFAADAKYGIVQTRRGMLGDAFSHWTLPRLTGMSVAADLLLTGRTFDGNEAKELGLCSRVLPNADVLPAALDIARDTSANVAPLSAAASKRLLWSTWDLDANGVGRAETALHQTLMAHPDTREAMAAYVERRTPSWSGRVSADLPDESARGD